MEAANNSLQIDPKSPKSVATLTAVSEVYAESEFAILVLVAALEDGSFAVWAQRRSCFVIITEPTTHPNLTRALDASERLIVSIQRYAYPDACA